MGNHKKYRIKSLYDNKLDYDGDLLMTSDNPYLVESVYEGNPITYAKNKQKEQFLNANSFANMDRYYVHLYRNI